jgi:competence protein ComEC
MPQISVFTSVINAYLPEPHASLANGILFGAPLRTTKLFYQQLKIVGLLHIVVLSGINITLLAAIVGQTTKFVSKRLSILITILIIISFIIFVGPQAPIIRAGIMGILTLVAITYGRRNFAIYSLFLSFVFTLIFYSRWIMTISFQLSYAATLGLIIFAKKSVDNQNENLILKLKNYIKDEFITSISAQIFTAPIIFFYFKEISIISPLANLLVSFTIAPLMVFGFLTAILGKIHFFLGIIPAYICYGLLSYVVWIVENLAKLQFAYLKF